MSQAPCTTSPANDQSRMAVRSPSTTSCSSSRLDRGGRARDLARDEQLRSSLGLVVVQDARNTRRCRPGCAAGPPADGRRASPSHTASPAGRRCPRVAGSPEPIRRSRWTTATNTRVCALWSRTASSRVAVAPAIVASVAAGRTPGVRHKRRGSEVVELVRTHRARSRRRGCARRADRPVSARSGHAGAPRIPIGASGVERTIPVTAYPCSSSRSAMNEPSWPVTPVTSARRTPVSPGTANAVS